MSMIQIVTAPDQVNASIIKGFLESNGIQTSYGPETPFGGTFGGGMTNVPHMIFVPENRAVEASKLLKEQGLIAS